MMSAHWSFLLLLMILSSSLGEKQDETYELRRDIEKLDNSVNELKQMILNNNLYSTARAVESFAAKRNQGNTLRSRARRDVEDLHVANVFVAMYDKAMETSTDVKALLENQGFCARPRSCLEHLRKGHTESGVYKIYTATFAKAIEVFCDQETDGGGWTVFQRRQDGSVDFYLGWSDYETGFGNLTGEFWLGNENIHQLTAEHNHELRIELENFESKKGYAKYSTFMIGPKSTNYVLVADGYSGDARDSLEHASENLKGQQFSTKDKDNDRYSGSCSMSAKGGWWYQSCCYANLNGLYVKGSTAATGVYWYDFTNSYESLKFVEMKFRENTND